MIWLYSNLSQIKALYCFFFFSPCFLAPLLVIMSVNLVLHNLKCHWIIFRFLYGDQARFFSDEIHLDLKHSKTGTLAMASAGENLNASQVLFSQMLIVKWFYVNKKLPHQFSSGILFRDVSEVVLKILMKSLCFQFYFTLRDDLDYLDGKHTVTLLIHGFTIKWNLD